MACERGSGGEGLDRSAQPRQHPVLGMQPLGRVRLLPTLALEQDRRGQRMISRVASDTQEPSPCYCTSTWHPGLTVRGPLRHAVVSACVHLPMQDKTLASSRRCAVCLLQGSGVILKAGCTRTSPVCKGREMCGHITPGSAEVTAPRPG